MAKKTVATAKKATKREPAKKTVTKKSVKTAKPAKKQAEAPEPALPSFPEEQILQAIPTQPAATETRTLPLKHVAWPISLTLIGIIVIAIVLQLPMLAIVSFFILLLALAVFTLLWARHKHGRWF